MAKPQISVVIPAYNEEKRIAACLKSILRQDFRPDRFEVIVVDNNSIDRTQEIIKINSPGVKVVKETRRGVVFARIRGVEEARGKIIAMTDADTIVPRFWLSKMVKAYEDKEVVAVGGNSDFEFKNNWIKICQFFINHFSLTFKTFPGYNMSFRKKAYYQCGGFSTKINLGEDFYLSVKIKKTGKVVVLVDNPVVPSSRRFFEDYFSYATKYIVNVITILIFDRPIFFKFKEVREETLTALATLKEKVKY